MARPALVTTLLASLAARPAFAHPGHGLVGWLHHGEVLAVAGAVLAALLGRRIARRPVRRPPR